MITDVNRLDQTMRYEQYAASDESSIAKLPGTDSYAYPEEGDVTKTKQFPHKLKTTASRYNPLFRLSVSDGILTDADYKKAMSGSAYLEPTIQNLLNNAIDTHAGLRYDITDFMNCRYASSVSGYHMITLRRFAYPIGDCLNKAANASNGGRAHDVGRLVTYSTEEINKLSEIMTMSFGMNWRELTADFWTPEVIGNESGASGLLGRLFEFSNPMYLQSQGLGQKAINVNPHYDQNKVYGPVDSITKTHIRDRGMNFNHEINLTFEYDLASYDKANPKASMLDLIANILVVTMNDAKFWPGATLWRGMQRGAFSHYLSVNNALKIGADFGQTVAYYKDQFNSLLGEGSWLDKAINLAKIMLKGAEGWALSKLTNALGRPTIAVTNSLLSGQNVGMWHVTIGNPFRPILSMGNMILTNTTMSFGDELGVDGFPTTMKVVCTLKHAKPRSRAEIEMMFNAGIARTYWMPTKAALKKQINGKRTAYRKVNDSDIISELTNEIYSLMDTHGLKFSGGDFEKNFNWQ